MSQRVTRSRTTSQIVSQETQFSQQPLKSQLHDGETSSDDDGGSDERKATPKVKKPPTTKRSLKKEYPPFTIKTPTLISHNPYVQRPFFGDVRPFSETTHGFGMDEPCMVGIDEAGRGPVLGPMVYGTCIVPITKVAELKALGVNDSKQLKELDREYLFSLVQGTDYLRWIVDRISPIVLSAKMLAASKESLNLISHMSALHMVCHYIKVGFNIQEVYADTVGPPEKYKEWMEREINEFCRQNGVKNTVLKVVVESKADATYPCVSAASICAKVTRDLDLAAWVCREDTDRFTVKEGLDQLGLDDTTHNNNNINNQLSTQTDMTDDVHSSLTNTHNITTTTTTTTNISPPMSRVFGSGYPGDDVTKSWLHDHFDPIFGFPDLVRFSWGTATKIINEDGYAVRWGDEEDLPARDGGTKNMAKFSFLKSPAVQHNQSPWPLMKRNNIAPTTDLPF